MRSPLITRPAPKTMISLILSGLIILALSGSGVCQNEPKQTEPQVPKLDDIAISPSRLELPMLPGTEKTVVVNLIYTADNGGGPPTRVIAYPGDWSISPKGKIIFFPAGSQSNSACSWLVYSPTEVTVQPGRVHPIRVTISVPPNATPGDHLAALFVEPRPENIKLEQNRRQVQVKFRLAAVFYIMVPDLTRKGTLSSLQSEDSDAGIVVTPTLENSGNTHTRPTYSIKILDQKGETVIETADTEALPVLAKSDSAMPVTIERKLPAGNYSVFYRVRFDDGLAVTEGQTSVLVKDKSSPRLTPPGTTPSKESKSEKK